MRNELVKNSPTRRPQVLTLGCILIFGLSTIVCHGQKTDPKPDATAHPEVKTPRVVFTDIPERIETSARYLFYLHGKIVEDEGVRPTSQKYGVYEYERILDTFKDKGFVAISEARAQNTDPQKYATKVTGQIQALLKARVPPQNITVVGASKGAVIAMLVSTGLKNRDVNFVLMANCNDDILKRFNLDLWGNVLSIYDVKDEFGQTCQKFFDKATGLNRHKEIELKIGTGHAILYRPIKEWVDPVVEWAANTLGRHQRSTPRTRD